MRHKTRYNLTTLGLIGAIATVAVVSLGGFSGIADIARFTAKAVGCSTEQCMAEIAISTAPATVGVAPASESANALFRSLPQH